MTKKIFGLAIALMLCLTMSLAHAQRGGKGGKEGGKEGSKQGNKPPGGNWSESKQQPQGGHKEAGAADAEKNKESNPSGGEKAAAGASAANRNQPKSSGAEGAAAGAAAANRNEPKASGAQGAAAGAAAANRNEPKASGAQGAAAGAAAASRNQPNVSGAQGAAAGAAAANRNQPNVSGAQGAAVGAAAANRNAPLTSGAAGYAAVRNSFDHPELYGENWHASNPNAWTGVGWAAGTAWNAASWDNLAAHCGYASTAPVSLNYGTNVTCVNGNVTLDGQVIGTAEEFSQQASELAQAGADADVSNNAKWLPVGVFAMVQNDQQHPHLILQIAVNENGILRGNYTDDVTENTMPIQGSVDPKTQRAAWTVGSNTNAVMEAGMSNLTEGHAPALLHKNGKTERWTLVQLPKPE